MEPDGRIAVTVSYDLATAWDPGDHEPKQDYVFDFTEVDGWSPDKEGLRIRFSGKGDRPKGFLIITWQSLLSYEVTTNSDEYVVWAKARKVMSDGR